MLLSNSISTFFTFIVESPLSQFVKPLVFKMSAPSADEMSDEARRAIVVDRMMANVRMLQILSYT